MCGPKFCGPTVGSMYTYGIHVCPACSEKPSVGEISLLSRESSPVFHYNCLFLKKFKSIASFFFPKWTWHIDYCSPHCSQCSSASFHFLWFKVKHDQFLQTFLADLFIHTVLQLLSNMRTQRYKQNFRWHFLGLADVARFFSCSDITFLGICKGYTYS